jgi:hypothetical protein
MTCYRLVLSFTTASLLWVVTHFSQRGNQGMPESHSREAVPAIAAEHKTPILPNVRGFGAYTTAGSGRNLTPIRSRVYRVVNLADSGPGSLRECIDNRGPRTCIFEISGEIRLRSILRIRKPYLTIAGQTAPSPGITLSRGGLSLETHDVLIQHIAVRPGDHPDGVSPRFRDGISVGVAAPLAAHNIVLDHLSVTWAIDENVSTAYPTTHDVTVAHSLIAEGLYNSIHPKGPHSKGIMVGNDSKRITLYQNLIAANEERNPYIKPGASVEMINNVVYGWGPRGGWSLCNLSNHDGTPNPVSLTFVGNIYIPAPWSYMAPPIYASVLAPSSRVYVDDNILLSPGHTINHPWEITSIDEDTFRAEIPPLLSDMRTPLSSQAAYQQVLTQVGSRPRQRSTIDQRIVRDVEYRGGSLKDCLKGCSRAVGETKVAPGRSRRLRLPRSLFTDSDGDGYTELENWLHRMALRVSQSG